MLLPLTPICSSKKVRKDGTSLIFIQYCRNAQDKTLLNTGIAIPPMYWHQKHKRILEKLPVSFGLAALLNRELQRQLRLAEDVISFALSKEMIDPVPFVKSIYQPNLNLSILEKAARQKTEAQPKLNKDFFFQYDAYIDSKLTTVSKATIDVFRNLKVLLNAFQEYRKKPITLDEIDIDFYHELMRYLTYEHIHQNKKEVVKGLKTNSVGKNVKQLIVFLKTPRIRKIVPDLNLTGFKIVEEEADAIYLTVEEINKIIKLDLSEHKHLGKYRDLLVFGCLTGLRFSDFSIIRSEDVRDGMLYKKQTKTKHWVVVPLRDEANQIFVHSFYRNIPVVNNAELNFYIKEVGRVAGIVQTIKHSYMKGNRTIHEIKPKYEFITSHTCRRSFCDVDGFGPENIYWMKNIPDGIYQIGVVYYGPEDGPVTDYTVKMINGLGVSKTFTGTVGYFEGRTISVASFRKTGKHIEFL